MKKFFILFAFIGIACNFVAQEIEEPVIIAAPDTVISKMAYTIAEQGITISVSNGTILPADHDWNPIDRTYFAVLAGANMTISAEQAIKGIAINGWIRKNFSASANYGTINYLDASLEDTEGEPVLTISDIDNTSVTITCENQIRCFSLEVYFTQNPGEIEEEHDVVDTVRFVAVTAEALDYSENESYSSEGSYSYWLSLSPEEVYPQVWLDMYSAVKGDLSGEYSLYNFNVGDYTYVQLSADESDYEYAYDQEFTISKTENGYHVEGYIIADNDIQYEFVYDGPIALNTDAIEQTVHASSSNRKYIKDGMLLIEKNGKIYNATGAEIK